MQSYSNRVQSLMQELTLEEKVALLAGASMWHTVAVERLGIPAIKVTDGPNGARGDAIFGAGKRAAAFPVGIALAATWNTDLVEQVGQALGEEALTKGARLLLAPTVNIHRSPLNGRNFECFSEDPYLASRMAVAYINGLQSRGVGASIKHFAGNNSEYERNTISSEIGERALREIYLPAFEAAVREAGTWAIMSAYNKVNGTSCCEHPQLLTSILREEWGFEGIVMSDWFGTYSTAPALNAGLDLEMPGPPLWRGQRLTDAVRSGEVKEEAIDAAAARVLHLIERVGALDEAGILEEQSIDRPEHRACARRAAAESVVLLKTNGLLPLDPEKLRSVAIIGPNAKTAQIMGGGSSQVKAHYVVTPFEGITAQLGPGVEVGYEIGCINHKFIPLIDMSRVEHDPNRSGFTAAYYNNLDLSGEPILHSTLEASETIWIDEIGPGVNAEAFSARITGRFTPEEGGPHTFGLASSGLSRLYVGGELIVDNWSSQTRGETFLGMGSSEQRGEVRLTAGEPVDILVEYSKESAGPIAGVRLGCLPEVPADAIERAAKLAASADVALVFVGSTGEWETEGADRASLDLVGKQSDLIEAVAAANPGTVVIVQTGSPIVMPWLDKPAAVMQAWLNGQECGNAIADVLFGKVDASGRLPQTFPKRLQDNPTYINYPGENGKVVYGEGIFVGYRYYDKKDIEPLFPFGFGLSYTTFDYANLRLSQGEISPGEIEGSLFPKGNPQGLEVTVDVTNSGQRAGSEVVQLYVRDPESAVQRPEKELKGFSKVTLKPGETRSVTFSLDRRALAYWDDAAQNWTAETGVFEVLIGRSALDIRLSASFRLTETAQFDGPGREAPRLTIDTIVKDLLANESARAIIDRHIPGFSSNSQVAFAQGFTLAQLAAFDAKTFSDEVLSAIDVELHNA
jgi:beta-glucosidase